MDIDLLLAQSRANIPDIGTTFRKRFVEAGCLMAEG